MMKYLKTYLLILLAGVIIVAYQDDDPITSCSDGIQNGTELGVDCGGDCGACASCSDGIQNGDETGVDCGGLFCPSCLISGCTNPNAHNDNPLAEIDDGSCETCFDGIQNGDETAVDCGGMCNACPTCTDGIQNGNETGIDCGGDCGYCIGDIGPGNGIIFFDKGSVSNGWRYLEAAPSDQAVAVKWGTPLNNFVGSTSVTVGSGFENSWIVFDHGIFVGSGLSIALGLEFGGKSDWFLPSRDELRELWMQRNIVGQFSNTSSYWSSSEYNTTRAWTLDFQQQSRIAIDKQNTARVRAIRRF